MAVKIALVGNPNSGKTTMFNELTGSSQYVGNWPGVTVEKKEGSLKGHKDVTIVDLPGVYSLSPYTLEEVVSRNFLINEKPDVIINIVDASNIERNLYLTTQLLELEIPMVIALNMMDVVDKVGTKINVDKLSHALGVPVIGISAIKGKGTVEAAKKAISLCGITQENVCKFCDEVEKAISDISELGIVKNNLRWYSIKFLERDEKVMADNKLPDEISSKLESIITSCEVTMDDDTESIITNERYMYINQVVKNAVKKNQATNMTFSDKIDKVVTNRFLALPIFALVMFIVYYVSVTTVGGIATDWANDGVFGEGFSFFGIWIKGVPVVVESILTKLNCAEWIHSLMLDGIVGGVGAVLGFVPQMMILFLFLAILEDCGYMARIAFIMDRIFRRFGLSGKSFIPMLIGSGCGVPGIMASRTIENESDRKMTIITTTFIPCGAKLPIIALIAGAFFSGNAWVAPVSYFIGVGAIIVSGIILKKTKGFAGEVAPFVMELPQYHLPSLKGVLIHMWDRAKSFIAKAGTIIFVACAAIWFLSSFDFSFNMVDITDSILASIGGVIAPIFRPLGWGDWKSTVATVTGLIAKENVVGTFGVLYGMGDVAENGAEIWANMKHAFDLESGGFGSLAAFSFLVFNLLCAPCFAAIGAIKREMGSLKWTLIAVGYQTGFAYAVSFIVYQVGKIVFGGSIGISTIIAFAMICIFIYLLFRKDKVANVNAVRAVKF